MCGWFGDENVVFWPKNLHDRFRYEDVCDVFRLFRYFYNYRWNNFDKFKFVNMHEKDTIKLSYGFLVPKHNYVFVIL